MGLFSKESSSEKQIEHYNELLDHTREQYQALENIQGSPEAEAQRNQLFEQIKQIEITIAEIQHQDIREKEQDQGEGLDLFED
ncbi:hypothetical protein CLV90_2773 [Maribacter spongiicola]|uniref:Uncharacterized protein n=2 Tax=Maribacter spongiicola TaxID=1206753 RepID=A0A4R7JYQ6_9FLAO|nr:hypothetical protein CLV90_2773 [Maribacter spongiicola]